MVGAEKHRGSPHRCNSSIEPEETGCLAAAQLGVPGRTMPGRAYLSSFFVFTARFVPTTQEIEKDEEREIIYDPELSRFRSHRSAAFMLPDRISGRPDRPSLRRSTIVRRFSHDLLH